MKQAEDNQKMELPLPLADPLDVNLLTRIQNQLALLTARRHDLQQKIDALSRAGCIQATPIYKEGKYLVLIGPMTAGKRQRTYIGKNLASQDYALAKLRRFEERAKLTEQLNALDIALRRIRRTLNMAAAESRAACETI